MQHSKAIVRLQARVQGEKGSLWRAEAEPWVSATLPSGPPKSPLLPDTCRPFPKCIGSISWGVDISTPLSSSPHLWSINWPSLKHGKETCKEKMFTQALRQIEGSSTPGQGFMYRFAQTECYANYCRDRTVGHSKGHLQCTQLIKVLISAASPPTP